MARFTVGRGPVPRHAPIAEETRSDARMETSEGPARRCMKRSRGTGPRATVSGTARFTVGRGPVPRHATLAGNRPPRYGKTAVFIRIGETAVEKTGSSGPLGPACL